MDEKTLSAVASNLTVAYFSLPEVKKENEGNTIRPQEARVKEIVKVYQELFNHLKLLLGEFSE
jgi:hypothetical protein